MNKNLKKMCAGTLALSVLGAANGALANTWKQVGYDTSDNAVSTGRYACVYQEYDEYGIATGNVKSGFEIYTLNMNVPAFAKTVAWANSFVDRTHTCSLSSKGDYYFANHDLLPEHDCGNLEYANLVLDGKKQERVAATGAYGNVNYRWSNWFWEKAEPHKIYQKKEANFGNGWYTDDSYPMRYSGQNEKVTVTQPQVYIDTNSLPLVGDATGNEGLFNKSVLKLYQRYLTGTTIPVTVIDDVTYTNNGLFTNGLLAEPKWVDAGYEQTPPYRMYQILSLDGYLMDGTNITIQTNDPENPMVIAKPYIFRYTGGFAKPTITYTDYKIDLSTYDSVNRTAEVVATIVLDGNKTTLPPVATGEYATLDYAEAYDNATAIKYIEGTFTARVNQNGKVVVMKATLADIVADGYRVYIDSVDNLVNWGYVNLYRVPQETNGYLW